MVLVANAVAFVAPASLSVASANDSPVDRWRDHDGDPVPAESSGCAGSVLFLASLVSSISLAVSLPD